MHNILFVSTGNTKEGISPLVKQQGESLIQHGHQVHYFTVQGKGLKGYLKSFFYLRKSLKTSVCHIIHAHYGLCGILALFAKKKQPLVVSFMGDDLLGSHKPDGRITKSSKVLVSINKLLSKWFYNFSIVKSVEMEKVLNHRKVKVIPNGVDTKKFYPISKIEARKKLNLPLTDQIVVFVSNPSRPEKNFPLVQESVKCLKDPNIKLIAVYNKSHEEINYWLNAADVLALASFHEGSPNVVKEAMACNCPVVSTPVGDVNQVFGNIPGCFLSDFSVKEYNQKLNEAIQYSKAHETTTGRERINECGLDIRATAKKITVLYTKLLAE
jgi:teichuronic acid biosynthesis glycosyltransferase TuaC